MVRKRGEGQGTRMKGAREAKAIGGRKGNVKGMCRVEGMGFIAEGRGRIGAVKARGKRENRSGEGVSLHVSLCPRIHRLLPAAGGGAPWPQLAEYDVRCTNAPLRADRVWRVSATARGPCAT